MESEITDRTAISADLRGHDAVVLTLGAAKPWRPSLDIVQGVEVVISAVKEAGVDCFVYMSASSVGESRGAVRGSVLKLMVPLMLKAASRSMPSTSRRCATAPRLNDRAPPLLTNGAASPRHPPRGLESLTRSRDCIRRVQTRSQRDTDHQPASETRLRGIWATWRSGPFNDTARTEWPIHSRKRLTCASSLSLL